jgi:hypothetical protein
MKKGSYVIIENILITQLWYLGSDPDCNLNLIYP